MSPTSGRHRKQPPGYAAPAPRRHRHRKPSPLASALKTQPTRVAAAVAGSAVLVTAGPAAAHLPALASRPAALAQADVFRAAMAGRVAAASARSGVTALASGASRDVALAKADSQAAAAAKRSLPAPVARHSAHRAARQPGYRNPLRGVSGLMPERIDQGVDFGGSGPVYALGDAVITNAQAGNSGWPGGGWITYQLTDGPDAGRMVFLAEDVTPQVQAGQHVTSSTMIATMYDGGDGIETGWAQASGLTTESQLPAAGGIDGNGPFPTAIGMNFEELLQFLGVPAGNNRVDAPSGVLPAGFPASWG